MDINRLSNPIEVERLAKILGAPHIGHELVLSDNIYENYFFDDSAAGIGKYPVKMVGASVVFCVEGSVSYRVNLAEHRVEAGDVLVVLPGSIMQISNADVDTKIVSISFSVDYYEHIVNVNPDMRNSPVIHIPQEYMDECLAAYMYLRGWLSRNAGNVTKSVAKGYIRVICSMLFDYWQICRNEKEDGIYSRPHDLYRRFLTKVQEEYHANRSVKYYADILCVTPKYLSTVVKRESGRNASDFIDELVIFESKALLAEGGYSVKQVAEMMDFPNPSFFAKYFRLHCGISPSAYRLLPH